MAARDRSEEGLCEIRVCSMSLASLMNLDLGQSPSWPGLLPNVELSSHASGVRHLLSSLPGVARRLGHPWLISDHASGVYFQPDGAGRNLAHASGVRHLLSSLPGVARRLGHPWLISDHASAAYFQPDRAGRNLARCARLLRTPGYRMSRTAHAGGVRGRFDVQQPPLPRRGLAFVESADS
jgi:hypothetical protein